eukprot:364903-Chlamydomonas_euryale.AAC.2
MALLLLYGQQRARGPFHTSHTYAQNHQPKTASAPPRARLRPCSYLTFQPPPTHMPATHQPAAVSASPRALPWLCSYLIFQHPPHKGRPTHQPVVVSASPRAPPQPRRIVVCLLAGAVHHTVGPAPAEVTAASAHKHEQGMHTV